MTHAALRRWLTLTWLAVVAISLFTYFQHREALEDWLGGASSRSLAAGGAAYLLLGCLRGFTLIPATSLVLIGLVFFPPGLLLVLTLAGILVSSACVYYFSEALHLDELLKRRHAKHFVRVQSLLERRSLLIITGWSFFPLVPTDLICYLAGVMRLPVATMLTGVALGEGAICAIYIYLGHSFLTATGLK